MNSKIPPQHQNHQPGHQNEMTPQPKSNKKHMHGSNKFKDRVILITGGDSGIGRAASIAFAKEGALIAINYLEETDDAKQTKKLIEEQGSSCFLLPGDISKEKACEKIIKDCVKHYGKLDVLINNAAVQFPQKSIEDITEEQLYKTFSTNIFSYFFMTKFALPHLKKGASIINTASVTAYRGSKDLIDYSSTKGAIVAFTRSLSSSVVDKGIRVNGVAPGPIWTPLIPASFDEKKVAHFGENTPMKRPGQPEEVAACYVFLASDESSYMTGQILHPNGGEIING